MHFTRMYIPTLKEAPADAEVISHKLLVRAGMIRKLTSGMYTFLPLGLRVLNRVAAVVREEMNACGAQEISMPIVQPGDLWAETGRWQAYGKELLRFTDRGQRQYCLGPTHEEVITDLIRGEVRSYRQLPLNLYQIHTKFRDEIRPRFGLLRCREFLMKDGYSFDVDEEAGIASYNTMLAAYQRIFQRLGIRFCTVEADSGAIGGNFSHEFMVLAATGEDTIASCQSCGYAANLEKAEIQAATAPATASSCADTPALEEVHTPDTTSIATVTDFLAISPAEVIKTLLFDVDGQAVAALVRGDRDINECKLSAVLGGPTQMGMASAEQVVQCSGAPVGFAGPVDLKVSRLIADNELLGDKTYVAGANKKDTHVKNVLLSRDAVAVEYADIRMITPQDPCPRCQKTLALTRGIEVGHIFKLGSKYSQAMGACFVDEAGTTRPLFMGCYGIGVSRIVAACIEQNHDSSGIIFPPPVAPFEVIVLCLDPQKDKVRNVAQELYSCLCKNTEVLLDDRTERPGVKFKDADLMGMPIQVTVGERGINNGVCEVKDRRSGEKTELPLADFSQAFARWRQDVWNGWDLMTTKDILEACR